MTEPSFSLGSIPVGWNWSVPCAFNPSGAYQPLAVDSSGNLNVNVQAGGGSGGGNSAAGTIGAAVPASGDYLAFSNALGTLVGVSTTNALPVTQSSQGSIGAATAPTAMLAAGAVYNSTAPTLTTGQSVALQCDASGALYTHANGGTQAVSIVAASSGGFSWTRATNGAAQTLSGSIKTSAGQLYSIVASNGGTATAYVRIFNLATAPTVGSSTGLVMVAPVPAGGTFVWNTDVGMVLGTGIAYDATAGFADSDTSTFTTANVISLTFGTK